MTLTLNAFCILPMSRPIVFVSSVSSDSITSRGRAALAASRGTAPLAVLKVDHQLELGRLHDWEVGGLVALDRR
jgi:hypothetical protein